MDRAWDAAVARTMVSVTRVDERRTLLHRRRGLGGREPAQTALRLGEDLIDSATVDPAIVPRFEAQNRPAIGGRG